MNTTILRANPEIQVKIRKAAQKLNCPSMPVMTFNKPNGDIVVSGCPTPSILPMLDRYASQIKVVAML